MPLERGKEKRNLFLKFPLLTVKSEALASPTATGRGEVSLVNMVRLFVKNSNITVNPKKGFTKTRWRTLKSRKDNWGGYGLCSIFICSLEADLYRPRELSSSLPY